MPRFFGSRQCIVCGQDNPAGMRLRFAVGQGEAETRWSPTPTFQGLPGVLHGGLALALCDDAMWYAVWGGGALTMTADAAIRYRRPVEVGQPLLVRGRVEQGRGRLFTCSAELRSGQDGAVLALATGKFLTVPPAQAERLRAERILHEFPQGGSEPPTTQ